jgi:hypothetical protein
MRWRPSLHQFPLKAHDVPAAPNVARGLLPDDEEAAEQYNSAQEAFAISAPKTHIRTWWRLLRKND